MKTKKFWNVVEDTTGNSFWEEAFIVDRKAYITELRKRNMFPIDKDYSEIEWAEDYESELFLDTGVIAQVYEDFFYLPNGTFDVDWKGDEVVLVTADFNNEDVLEEILQLDGFQRFSWGWAR